MTYAKLTDSNTIAYPPATCVHDLSGYAIFVLVLFVWLRIFER